MLPTCPRCGVKGPGLVFCRACHTLLPAVGGRRYFERLGLSPRFALDERELVAALKKAQSVLHPDRLVHADAEQRTLASQHSCLLNDAFHCLRDPYLRAAYLLEEAGVDVVGVKTDPGFLQHMLDLQEALEEGDPQAVKSRAQFEEGELLAEIGSMFESLAAPALQGRADLAERVARLRYYRRLQEQIKQREEELD